MGENKHINELDAFAKKHIQELSAEKAGPNFTATVMKSILSSQSFAKFKYEPLISRRTWMIIFTAFVGLFFIPFESSTTKEPSNSLADAIDLSWFTDFSFSNLLSGMDLSLSNSSSYAMFFCGVMILIQVLVLKNYFSSKIH